MAKKKKTDEEQAPLVVEEPKKFPPPRKSSFTKNLDIILTDDEVRQRGIEIATIYRDIGKLESGLKELIKEKKQDISKLEMKLAEIAYEVREGKRQDDVHCESTMHFDLLRVVSIRLDTGEELENRPFSDEEAMKYRKPELPFDKRSDETTVTPLDDTIPIGGEEDEDEGIRVIDPDLVDLDPESEREPDDDDDDDDDDDEDEEN